MTNQSTNTAPDNGANNQPTVNERLNEIIRRAYRGEVSWIHDQLQGTSVFEEALRGVDKDILNTKQALISLIKELVAKAKPDDFLPKGHHPDACLNHVRYTSACCGCQKQRARNYAIDEFEQNLLKALEEV